MVFIIPFPGKSDPQQNQANYELRVSFLIKSQEVRYRLGFVCLFVLPDVIQWFSHTQPRHRKAR